MGVRGEEEGEGAVQRADGVRDPVALDGGGLELSPSQQYASPPAPNRRGGG